LAPFSRHGKSEEERIEVAADEVLSAIADGRNISIRYAIIKGYLEVKKIKDRLIPTEGIRRIIQSSISLFDCKINGNTNFSMSTFRGKAMFRLVTFSGDADFHMDIFSQNTYFSENTFCKNAYFAGISFSRNVEIVDFNHATFRGDVYFSGATFRGKTDFSDTKFSRSAYFGGATMERPANFSGVIFYENTVSAGLWNHILCPAVRFLSGTVAWLLNRLTDLIPIIPVAWLRSIPTVELPETPVTNFLNFNTTTVMDGSSNPYLKRYIDDEQWIASWRERSQLQRVLFIVWEATSHCGRSIGLWATWSLFFAFLFALAYTPSPDWMPDWWCDFWQKHGAEFEQMAEAYANKPMSFWSSFYFSIVSFTTLGFGDVATANSFARFLVTFEVVLGYIMLGGLISIFANKLARRA